MSEGGKDPILELKGLVSHRIVGVIVVVEFIHGPGPKGMPECYVLLPM